MSVMNWLLSNWQAVISVLTLLLSASVTILHMAHAEATAASIQGLEDALSKLISKTPPPPSS